MYRIAIKMLVGNRGKYIGTLMGVLFASLLMTHMSSVFVGVMSRTFAAITDLALPDIWVMDPKVQFIDDSKPMIDTALQRVRGIEGVRWAVPLYKGTLKARLSNGQFQNCTVLGLDDATLIGGPPEMVDGKLDNLRQADGVIVDLDAATGQLARPDPQNAGQTTPLRIGDTLELNDRRAVVVGVCRNSKPFQTQPIIYTTYSRATQYAPRERKLLTYVLVKAGHPDDVPALCERIQRGTGLMALTGGQFKTRTYWYFMKSTGIPINIGLMMVISFIVGAAITGQTFYTFTLENLRHFGALKAMGADNRVLLRMILLQALLIGAVGYGLGVGASSFFGYMISGTQAAWRLLWPQLFLSGATVLVICSATALLCIRRVVKLEPAVVFRS